MAVAKFYMKQNRERTVEPSNYNLSHSGRNECRCHQYLLTLVDLAFRDSTLKAELLISLRRLAAIVPQSEKRNADWLNRAVTDSVH